MKLEALELAGAYYIEPKLHYDARGYFFEWFNQEEFKNKTGINFQAVQFNYSKSQRGVLRGLHFQLNPKSQGKLVAVTKGEIQEVIVDLRKDSPTFGKSYSIILSEEKRNQLFIPKGFAHGFLVLSEIAEIFYAVDEGYAPEVEGGIMYNDAAVGVEWELGESEMLLSDKDKIYAPLEQADINF
jgi:dTDP-4-dehydrorhamnose 3,5-epimerase